MGGEKRRSVNSSERGRCGVGAKGQEGKGTIALLLN